MYTTKKTTCNLPSSRVSVCICSELFCVRSRLDISCPSAGVTTIFNGSPATTLCGASKVSEKSGGLVSSGKVGSVESLPEHKASKTQKEDPYRALLKRSGCVSLPCDCQIVELERLSRCVFYSIYMKLKKLLSKRLLCQIPDIARKR